MDILKDEFGKLEFCIKGLVSTKLNVAKGEPASFDETNDGRRFRMETVLGKFDVYIKYTKNASSVSEGGRTRTSWYISFTKVEMDELNEDFVSDEYKSYIVLLLCDGKLSYGKVAIINREDAYNCLKDVTESGDMGINVVRYDTDRNFICYGALQQESDGFIVPITFTKFLDRNRNEED